MLLSPTAVSASSPSLLPLTRLELKRISPAAIILGTLAWLLVFFDGFLVIRKEKQGGADLCAHLPLSRGPESTLTAIPSCSIIDTFLSKGKDRTMKEHRRLERRITIGTTLALFLLWVRPLSLSLLHVR